jgi:hypothetical protein
MVRAQPHDMWLVYKYVIMLIHEIISETLTPPQLDQVERFADRLWHKLGIDVSFTQHFMQRLNDPRNGTDITVSGLIRLFRQEYQRYGRDIAALDSGSQAVMRDLVTHLNLPFVIQQDMGDTRQLKIKTIMRKPQFHTPNPVYAVSE